MTSKLKPLTYRERKFVDALFLTKPPMNGTEAARIAGFSKVGASVQAVRMLRKANIQAAITKRKEAAETVADVTKTQWENKVKRLCHGDVRKLFDAHNNPIDIALLGDNEALMIEGFEVVEDFTKVKQNDGSTEAVPTGYTKKIKYTKPREALEFVGKALGYYTDKVEHTGAFTLAQLVEALDHPDDQHE